MREALQALSGQKQQKSRDSRVDNNSITDVIEATDRIGIPRRRDINSTDKTLPEKAAPFETGSRWPVSTPSQRNGSVELPPSYKTSEAQSRTVEPVPTVEPDRDARADLVANRPPRRPYSR